MQILLLIILVLALCAAFSIFVHTLVNGISPMPSSRKARSVVVSIAKEQFSSGTIVDLGSGWGTLCFSLGRALPQARIIGYESSLIPYLYCRCAKAILRSTNVAFRCKDLFKTSHDNADGILYYYPQ
jgi:methylase of polypeptide subunit release factors